MALLSDAAMVLFYDIAGDTADHDDWHSFEHFHERLSVPGFERATRWIATEAAPRYLVIYEVSDIAVASSPAYLARLNDPTVWTRAIMPRFRHMVRGFATIAASAGFGLGAAATAVRFTPEDGAAPALVEWVAGEILPALAMTRGVAGGHLMRPAPPPPMTREQQLRGADRPLPWLLLMTGYDAGALEGAIAAHLGPRACEDHGLRDMTVGCYALHHTASAAEVARTPKPVALGASGRSG